MRNKCRGDPEQFGIDCMIGTAGIIETFYVMFYRLMNWSLLKLTLNKGKTGGEYSAGIWEIMSLE